MDSSGEGPGPSGNTNFVEWDYEADLELVKRKLAKSKTKERTRLRHLISACLTDNTRTETEPDDHDKDRDNEAQFFKDQRSRKIPTKTNSRLQIRPEVLSNYLCKALMSLVLISDTLEILLIKNKIMSYLPVSSLLTCRLVNRYWNEMALPWIQKKNTKRVVVRPKDFSMFCATFEESVVLPFVKLGLDINAVPVIDGTLLKFFIKHGARIQDLEIRENIGGVERFQWCAVLDELKMIFRNISNAKKLVLNLQNLFLFNEQDLPDVILPNVEILELSSNATLSETFFRGLFRILPNVQVVHLGKCADEQNWETLVAPMQNLNIHAMHLPNIAEPAGFWRALTTEASFHLRQLSMCLVLQSSHEDLLQAQIEFWESQKKYLQFLQLAILKQSSLNQPDLMLRLPDLKNLKILSISGCSTLFEFSPFLSPIEPEQVPNLQILQIYPQLINTTVFSNFIFPSVQEIELLWEREGKGIHSLTFNAYVTQLATSFPNLKKLGCFQVNSNTQLRELFLAKF